MRDRIRVEGVIGCSDHGCMFGHPGGMGTNGGCACEREIRGVDARRRIRKNVELMRNRIAELENQLNEKTTWIKP